MANEKRLIYAEDAEKALFALRKGFRRTDEKCAVGACILEIKDVPTVEAEPVVHGRWITHNKRQNNWCECSECNTVGSPFWKRCPVCEAKMDGDGNG